jgi:hypothetical protein
VTEVNRRRELGTREKVSSRRINLEYNTHAQESKDPLSFLLLLILSSTKLEIRAK